RTAMRSASRSASSRYCVVRSSVVPRPTRSAINAQTSRRPRGSRPVVGSSRNRTEGDATRPAAMSTRRRMPPEYVRTGRPATSGGRGALRRSGGPPAGHPLAEMGEAADEPQVLAAGEVLVHSGELAGEADERADRVGLTGHVVTGDPGAAAAGRQ